MKNKIIVRLLNGAIVVTLISAMTQTASANGLPLPDAGSTSALMGLAFAALVAIRRFLR
jgi:hypothetical protein